MQLGSLTGKGTLHAYVTQKAIKFNRVLNPEKIVVSSAKRGFIPLDFGEHYVPEHDVMITDTWGDNVTELKPDENGKPVVGFIDPIIRHPLGEWRGIAPASRGNRPGPSRHPTLPA